MNAVPTPSFHLEKALKDGTFPNGSVRSVMHGGMPTLARTWLLLLVSPSERCSIFAPITNRMVQRQRYTL
jgi:hypothetical protein